MHVDESGLTTHVHLLHGSAHSKQKHFFIYHQVLLATSTGVITWDSKCAKERLDALNLNLQVWRPLLGLFLNIAHNLEKKSWSASENRLYG